ncbi:MAG TPA: UPF0146 family protein [Methanospirillum sp.]|uniref:UPF0146 family protein n=1 Tax=Methanospirillum sp. TaxID=45200 RepID=UPI002BE76275|nr:UPF0146 family protein [Methanospirillum sp.]HOJ95407.1 UPF0146 family protein [Methanospirillum sp.]HOL40360.1 UPF0146 family protein [Methanospirillum sp.]HPP78301.1 UPF0146 family protein [Methanospirillum sp.]
MSGYKYIETAVARFIAGRYRSVIEAGAGTNLHAASLLFRSGILIRCIDIIDPPRWSCVPYFKDDIDHPNLCLYQNCDCIYAIRPTEEMIPPLIRLSEQIQADLIVYHLGFEGADRPAPIAGCDVPLHMYVKN